MPADPCRSFEPRLSAFLDGELPREEAESLRRHLSGCTACTARLQEMKEADLALAELPAPEPSPFFTARVAAAARALNEYHGPFRRFLNFPVPVMAVLSAFLIFNVLTFGTNISAMETSQRQELVGKVVKHLSKPASLINPVAVARLCSDCSVYMCGCMHSSGRKHLCTCEDCSMGTDAADGGAGEEEEDHHVR